jgi:hypothetical protein
MTREGIFETDIPFFVGIENDKYYGLTNEYHWNPKAPQRKDAILFWVKKGE